MTLPDEADFKRVVHAFYAQVRNDPELGPVFNAAIGDWPEHERRLVDFWSSVMLTSGRYKGNPMAAHLKHREAITPAMFDHWLALWRKTTDQLLSSGVADAMQAKAEMIAKSLQLALYFRLDPAPKAI